MTAIVAFDPGETTGIAYLDGALSVYTTTVGWEALEGWIDVADVVVVEEFRLYPHKARAKIGSTFPEVEVIGVIKDTARRYCRPVVMQPASHKKFWTDARLRAEGCLVASPHARDAARHALYYREFGPS